MTIFTCKWKCIERISSGKKKMVRALSYHYLVWLFLFSLVREFNKKNCAQGESKLGELILSLNLKEKACIFMIFR